MPENPEAVEELTDYKKIKMQNEKPKLWNPDRMCIAHHLLMRMVCDAHPTQFYILIFYFFSSVVFA